MDFSKWKKIFYILMIISLIMNIFSKVFGSFEFNGDINTYILPDEVNEYEFILVVAERWSSYVLASNTEFYINERGGNIFIGFKEPNVSYISAKKNNSTNYDFSSNTFNSYTAPSYFNGTDKIYQIMNYGGGTVCASNYDVRNSITSEIYFESSNLSQPPEITTSQEKLENLNFKNLEVDLHDYQGQDVYLLTYDKSSTTNIDIGDGNTIDYQALYTDMISDVLGLDNSSSEYATNEDLVKLYPRKEILLNSDSNYYKGQLIDNGSNYSIPLTDLGLSFKIDGTYAFRFAIREPIESEFSDWAYTYLGDSTEFVVIKNMSGMALEELEKEAEEKQRQKEREEDKNLQQEQTNAIIEQKEQDAEFYNNILSNDYDENKADDTLSGMTESTDDIDDSQYTGLFSAVFGKFSNIVNGDFSQVERIEYPVPNTNEKIVITSDLLSSKIQGTFLFVFLQAFWLFLFGMYIFKFSNNLIRKIKSGSILNGYENKDEVITSTML